MGIFTGNSPVAVRIVRRNNDLVLVEWTGDDGILRRNQVASGRLQNDKGRVAEVESPETGVPYGVEFWRVLGEPQVTTKDIDRELKMRGIWTVQDVRTRPNEVIGALMAAYGVDLAAILRAADEYERMLTEA